jgi:hypothetical protein
VTLWPDIERDLRRVLEHAGFVELSRHPELEMPWAVGIQLGVPWNPLRITWFRATSLIGALAQAVVGIERLDG